MSGDGNGGDQSEPTLGPGLDGGGLDARDQTYKLQCRSDRGHVLWAALKSDSSGYCCSPSVAVSYV